MAPLTPECRSVEGGLRVRVRPGPGATNFVVETAFVVFILAARPKQKQSTRAKKRNRPLRHTRSIYTRRVTDTAMCFALSEPSCTRMCVLARRGGASRTSLPSCPQFTSCRPSLGFRRGAPWKPSAHTCRSAAWWLRVRESLVLRARRRDEFTRPRQACTLRAEAVRWRA
jgi:hypothetical protein